MSSATRMGLIASLLVGLSGTGNADVITDWNDRVVTAGVKASQAPFVHTRSVPIVHAAMFDAVNSIDRRYTPYRVQLSAAPGTSGEAAAAAAAHLALVRLYPDQAAAVLEAFFGDAVPAFNLTSPAVPGVVRKFKRLSDYVSESIDARVYGGVHYRTSGEVGAATGRKIGEYTVQNYLKPVRNVTDR